jgi:hypothetical protein
LSMREPSSSRDEAWSVFADYIERANQHDINGLSMFAHKLSNVCLDPNSMVECYQRMDQVYQSAKDFRLEDFTIYWESGRQIIMMTDWQTEENEAFKILYRGAIYFTRDIAGKPRVLYITQPYEIIAVTKLNRTDSETTTLLEDMSKDSDMDAIADQVETCDYVGVDLNKCKQTDPHKRDTDADGWWDSIDALLSDNGLVSFTNNGGLDKPTLNIDKDIILKLFKLE